jgi:K+-sensing histidine kinase KdpD
MFASFMVVGLSILLFADFWTKFSQSLGVGSSTQLLTYLVTFAFIASTISNYRWRREQEQRLVDLARQIALNTNQE